jgi:hypothetical protein
MGTSAKEIRNRDAARPSATTGTALRCGRCVPARSAPPKAEVDDLLLAVVAQPKATRTGLRRDGTGLAGERDASRIRAFWQAGRKSSWTEDILAALGKRSCSAAPA